MADPRHSFGSQAEDLVASWLVASGWRVLARRYRSPGGGEVDLVALDPRGTLVGLEVRARRSARAGPPEDTVDARHAARIGRSLAAFGASGVARHVGLRVDLVAVDREPGAPVRYRLRRFPAVGG